MSSEPAVRVTDLHKHYGAERAVDGVSFDVAPGQVFALLGPNGAGKSTTVEVLEGYRARTSGEVSVLGADPGRPTPVWRSRLGIVAQSTRDLSDLTVTEVVRQFATFYPHPRRPEAVIEQVGLADDARTRASALSGGRRRRLDVALGIVGDPELLFLDEPTTGFDPEARREFWALVQLLAADGTTILLTTHYLDEVEVLADALAVIDGGRIVATGTPADLGGRDTAPATVRWRDAGGWRTELTPQPAALVARLHAQVGELDGLSVHRPTLEDAYLSLLSSTTSQEASR
ncbi:ABC transporter ATP-binding protein [Quadrisphaera sp. INWT6]|uniref:ABC transporter ATP-binding protein n=1 Tax=Quadrisphaera sp. INWT6 TaxID=2596917 RepID=UPI0018927F76|nr:ABC transporter ATP-binding protein [Quadrisphaera sp. INWT6]MBF5082074.1 ABC transporter ATP-binding protein [Quadrisphaera sp. INWT6]